MYSLMQDMGKWNNENMNYPIKHKTQGRQCQT